MRHSEWFFSVAILRRCFSSIIPFSWRRAASRRLSSVRASPLEKCNQKIFCLFSISLPEECFACSRILRRAFSERARRRKTRIRERSALLRKTGILCCCSNQVKKFPILNREQNILLAFLERMNFIDKEDCFSSEEFLSAFRLFCNFSNAFYSFGNC